MNLFSLVQSFENSETVDLTTGEITYNEPSIEKEEFTKEKIDRCVLHLRSLESQSTAVNSLIKEMCGNKAMLDAKIERFKKYLALCLRVSEQEKLLGNTFKIGTRKGSLSVQINDYDKIPSSYLIQEIEVKVDKRAISAAIKEGIEVPGAELKLGEETISISGGA